MPPVIRVRGGDYLQGTVADGYLNCTRGIKIWHGCISTNSVYISLFGNKLEVIVL